MYVILISLHLIVVTSGANNENLQLIAKLHSTFLETYTEYSDVVLMHTHVPSDVSMASFKFHAEEINLGIFPCLPQEVLLYLKQGAPPFLNPDGSKLPKHFFNLSSSEIHMAEFLSDKSNYYLNISAPMPGVYYFVTFHPWKDPLQASITQQGLTPQCYTVVDVELYIRQEEVESIIPNMDTSIRLSGDSSKFYKFKSADFVENALLNVSSVDNELLKIRIKSMNAPSLEDNVTLTVTRNEIPLAFDWKVDGDSWYYIRFDSTSGTDVTFNVKLFASNVTEDILIDKGNSSAVVKVLSRTELSENMYYDEYSLIRVANTENFVFAMTVPEQNETTSELNLTTSKFTVLKFTLRDYVDFGGSLGISVAFKPNVKQNARSTEIRNGQYLVVGCIQTNSFRQPKYPDKCLSDGVESIAPLLLNESTKNDTALIPLPASGNWFITFGLFEKVEKKNNFICPNLCQDDFGSCIRNCQKNCIIETYCENCHNLCRKEIVARSLCTTCGQRIEARSADENVTIEFQIISNPCTPGNCGEQGKCIFLVSQGLVFSACSCRRNYRGWDCSDDTYANPMSLVVLEMVLLVVSNLMFIPSIYFAYKREYYIECVVYSTIFFFSTFYHACDAGEDIISFCLVNGNALQFGDFFCALLAIWVTLIAVAHLPLLWLSLCHMAGAIFIAFGTTLDRLSLWVFLVPSVVGIVIVLTRWALSFRKYRTVLINRKYLYVKLPIGVGIVLVGLLIYVAFQTQSNYKYTHSLWHIFVATAIILILPSKNTFLPPEQLNVPDNQF